MIGGGRLVLRIYGIGLAPREKLGDDPRNPRLLKTVRGVGYMLAAASSSETPQ
ncbi:MAG TPA: helix-turn-helix domain-containing protein [Myxococcales bacterium]|nr:helix-turn-helix domain-containing protein [Myxococcales bacterium]